MGIAERLKKRLKDLGWSTRRFQQEVEKVAPDVTGTSYASVYAYVDGRTDPPLSFLTVAAQVLRVRPAWLAFGDPPESPAEDPVRETVRHGSQAVVFASLGMGENLMVELVKKLLEAQPPGSPELSDNDLLTIAKALQLNLINTLSALTRGGEVGPSSPSTQYILMSLMAMLAAVPRPGKGRPLAEVLRKLPQRGSREGLELKRKRRAPRSPKKGDH